MAKRIILEALQSTLGKYCSNLDVSTLKVRLFDGKITLKDLKLNVDAVNAELKALPSPPPFHVVGGSLGEVLVEIPWTKLSSKSVKVQISSLTILAETSSSSTSDATEHSSSERQNPLIRQTNVTAQNHTRLKTRQLTHSDLWDVDNEEQEEVRREVGTRTHTHTHTFDHEESPQIFLLTPRLALHSSRFTPRASLLSLRSSP